MQTCVEQPCSGKVIARGLCGNHYAKAKRHGRLDSYPRMDRHGANASNFGRRGPETSQWKGEHVGYRGAHLRLTRLYGQPQSCSLCGAEGPERRYEWALRTDAQTIRLDEHTTMRGRTFSPWPWDYIRLCNQCHHTYDHGGGVLFCKNCTEPFIMRRINQLFCTRKCTRDYFNRLRTSQAAR